MGRATPLTSLERRAYRLGCRCYERGEVDAALAAFRGLLETRSGFADVHYRVGILLERKGDLPGAARSLKQALRINPEYSEALLALASLYERQGDYRRSREIAERARASGRAVEGGLDFTTRGKLANLQAELGDAYREAGEGSEAIEAYRKALDRCPGFHDIRMRLGTALRDAGLPHQAISEFEQILRDDPDYLEAAVQRGLTLYSLGRGEDAVGAWRAVIERDPGQREALMYLRLVRPADAPHAPESRPAARSRPGAESRAPRSPATRRRHRFPPRPAPGPG